MALPFDYAVIVASVAIGYLRRPGGAEGEGRGVSAPDSRNGCRKNADERETNRARNL